MDIEVIRSERRRKTLSARIVDGVIQVRVPAGMPRREEEAQVQKLAARVRAKHQAGAVNLTDRAARLAKRYGLPQPTSITWATNQQQRWGSCTTGAGTIRISSRLANVPDFVLDHVIIHELAHLVHPNHSAAFHKLANVHPKAERAEGYLLAMSHGHVPNPATSRGF